MRVLAGEPFRQGFWPDVGRQRCVASVMCVQSGEKSNSIRVTGNFQQVRTLDTYKKKYFIMIVFVLIRFRNTKTDKQGGWVAGWTAQWQT